MGKGKKDSAVEQVMNELHQEMNSSFSSPDLFTPDLVRATRSLISAIAQ